MIAHHRTASILSAVLLTSVIPASHARAQSPLQSSRPVEIGTEFTLSSSVFGTERRIIVVTPPDYADTDYAYPIVYTTDGSGHTLTKAGIVAFQQFTAHMPGAIFVGIVNEDRMGDMTPTHVSENPTSGGAPRLLEFILNEVHPFVAARHRVHDHRTLVGHSLGGLFTINAVLEQPDAFDNYLAIAPALWYDDEVTLRKATEALSPDTAFNGSLYLTIGGNDGYGMRMELQRFVHLLEALAPSTLRWTHDVVPGEEHESTVLLSWFRGLRWLFRDIALTEALRESPDPTAIRAHLERIQAKYGPSAKLPEIDLAVMGSELADQGDFDGAAELHRISTELYPERVFGYERLVDALERGGRYEAAEEAYRNAARIATELNHVRADHYRQKAAEMRNREGLQKPLYCEAGKLILTISIS